MENYIVRIYRRDAADPSKIAGVFESVEQETENTFTSLKSLFSLLASRPADCSREASGDTEDTLNTTQSVRD